MDLGQDFKASFKRGNEGLVGGEKSKKSKAEIFWLSLKSMIQAYWIFCLPVAPWI